MLNLRVRGRGWAKRALVEAMEGRVLLSAGDVDTSFDGDGWATIRPEVTGSAVNVTQAMAVQADDKVIIGGYSSTAISTALPPPFPDGFVLTVARTNHDGGIDEDFGNGGVLPPYPPVEGQPPTDPRPLVKGVFQIDLPGKEDLRSIAIDSQGGIILQGMVNDSGVRSVFVMRLTSDGHPDINFNTGHPLLISGLVSDANDVAVDVVTDVNGVVSNFILLACTSKTSDLAVLRLTDNGSIDASFGIGGLALPIPDNYDDAASSILVQSNGDIVVAGYKIVDAGNLLNDWVLARFESNGLPDTLFGTAGEVVFDAGGDSDVIYDLAQEPEPDGRIIAAGAGLDGLTSDGLTMSPTILVGAFDVAGGTPAGLTSILVAEAAYSAANAVTVQPDGKIIAAGYTFNATSYKDVVITRLTPDLELDPDFDADGLQILGWDQLSDQLPQATFDEAVGLGLQSTGRIIAAVRTPSDSQAPNNTPSTLTLVGLQGDAPVIENHPPTACAGEDQTAYEGSLVALNGIASDPDIGDALTYLWHVTSTNVQVITDGTDLNFTFTPADDGIYTVTFTVTDSHGASASDTVVVTALNVAPNATMSGPTSGVVSAPLTYSVSITDPGSLDTHTVAWTATDASNVVVASGGGVEVVDFSFTPLTSSSFTVTAVVTDDDGASVTVQQNVTVAALSAVSIVDGQLLVAGQAGGQSIVLGRSGGQVSVAIDGVSQGLFSGFSQVVIHCGGGNDVVTISPLVGVPCDVHGGGGNDILVAGSAGDMLLGDNGNDILVGGGGADILVGGDGRDLISGGYGNDLLIGGHGSDLILGNAGDDVLVAGSSSYDDNPTALKAIRAEWASGRTYAQRVANIQGPGPSQGSNGTYFLTPDVTVFDDGAVDILAGNSGSDWFIFNVDFGVRDLVLDRNAFEIASDVDLLDGLSA
jgi:uncharacterized delta-60 repeat protein